MENFLQNIEDTEAFKQSVKDALDQTAMQELDNLKREMSQDFLQGEDE